MRYTVAFSAVAVALLAAGCSSGSGAAAPAGSAAGSQTRASATAAAASPIRTGVQLKALLAPASWFPAGYRLDKSGSVDTGATLHPVEAPKKLACSRLNGTSWVELGGVGAASFAENDYVRKGSSEYAQEIDVFKGASAARVMAALKALPGRCSSFHDSDTDSTVKVSAGKAPELGDGAIMIRLKDAAWSGDSALEAVRVGNAVSTVFFSASTGNGVAQANRLSSYLAGKLA